MAQRILETSVGFKLRRNIGRAKQLDDVVAPIRAEFEALKVDEESQPRMAAFVYRWLARNRLRAPNVDAAYLRTMDACRQIASGGPGTLDGNDLKGLRLKLTEADIAELGRLKSFAPTTLDPTEAGP